MRAIYHRFGTMLVAKQVGISMHHGRRKYILHLWGRPSWMLIGPTYTEDNNRLVRSFKRNIEQ
jgi:hypothetical protein